MKEMLRPVTIKQVRIDGIKEEQKQKVLDWIGFL